MPLPVRGSLTYEKIFYTFYLVRFAFLFVNETAEGAHRVEGRGVTSRNILWLWPEVETLRHKILFFLLAECVLVRVAIVIQHIHLTPKGIVVCLTKAAFHHSQWLFILVQLSNCMGIDWKNVSAFNSTVFFYLVELSPRAAHGLAEPRIHSLSPICGPQ